MFIDDILYYEPVQKPDLGLQIDILKQTKAKGRSNRKPISMDEKYRKIDPGLPERLGGNLKTLEQVYDSGFSELKDKDVQEVAVKCGARIDANNILAIDYFNKIIIIYI